MVTESFVSCGDANSTVLSKALFDRLRDVATFRSFPFSFASIGGLRYERIHQFESECGSYCLYMLPSDCIRLNF